MQRGEGVAPHRLVQLTTALDVQIAWLQRQHAALKQRHHVAWRECLGNERAAAVVQARKEVEAVEERIQVLWPQYVAQEERARERALEEKFRRLQSR